MNAAPPEISLFNPDPPETPDSSLTPSGINPNQSLLNNHGTGTDHDERNVPNEPFHSSMNPADWTSKANWMTRDLGANPSSDAVIQENMFPKTVAKERTVPLNMRLSQDNGKVPGTDSPKEVKDTPITDSRGDIRARFVIETLKNAGRDTTGIDQDNLAASLEDQGVDLRKSKEKSVAKFGKSVEGVARGVHKAYKGRILGSDNRVLRNPKTDSIVPVDVQHTAQLSPKNWWQERKRLKAVWKEYDRRTAATELKYLRKVDLHIDPSQKLPKSLQRDIERREKFIHALEHHEHTAEIKLHNLTYGGATFELTRFIPGVNKHIHIDMGTIRRLEKHARALSVAKEESEDTAAQERSHTPTRGDQTRRQRPNRAKRHTKKVKTKRISLSQPVNH